MVDQYLTDALVIEVLTPTYPTSKGMRERYASVNAISDHGATHGKKSIEYLDLFRAVREAARAEMARVGWETWPHACEVTIVRYHRTQQMSDAFNLGKVELDSMQPSTPHEDARDHTPPFAGVYLDDSQARDGRVVSEYDPAGPDRVLIIVRRCYPSAVSLAPAKRPRKPSQERAERPASVVVAPEPKTRPAASRRGESSRSEHVLRLEGLAGVVEMPRDEVLRRMSGGTRSGRK